MDTIEICGIEFDIPSKDDLSKRWNRREWKESRSTFKEMWIDNYSDGKEKHRTSMCLVLKNDSMATLDGKRLKEKDFENARKMFSIAEEVMK